MFYLRYLQAELTRRWGKTLTISCGLAIASAIIIAIVSTSESLSSSQKEVLNPLKNVGTDILVTRSVNNEGLAQLDQATREEFMEENRVSMDLSQMGKAGESFSRDIFLTGTMLTFASSEAAKLDPALVKESAAGLLLNVTHQEGKIPEIVAEFQTGGERVQVSQDITPLTEEEEQAMAEARAKAMEDLRAKGIDPRSNEGRKFLRDAANAATPERLKKFTGEYITPQRTFRQQLETPQTDIQTENLVVAGVDTSKSEIGLILPSQIVQGSYFNSVDQAVASVSYAEKKNLKVGDKINLNGKELAVVGLVAPKLYTNAADIYLPLNDLQKLSSREERVNVLLVKSKNANSVEETSEKLAGLFPGAKAIDSSDTAKQVTGSLVDAANLTNRFVVLMSGVVILAAFIIVSLLTLLSVNKRIREIGTLKAIGWNNFTIIRQILLENIVLGLIGAALGVGLGVFLIVILNQYNLSLTADVASLNGSSGFSNFFTRFAGGAATGAATVVADIKLQISFTILTLVLGAGVAILGSVLAGTLAAVKSSKMRPQEALRQLE